MEGGGGGGRERERERERERDRERDRDRETERQRQRDREIVQMAHQSSKHLRSLLTSLFSRDTEDAEIKVLFAENRAVSKVPPPPPLFLFFSPPFFSFFLSFFIKPEAGQNISTRASPIIRNSVFFSSDFRVHSTSFPPFPQSPSGMKLRVERSSRLGFTCDSMTCVTSP